jgi:hypothetical protein
MTSLSRVSVGSFASLLALSAIPAFTQEYTPQVLRVHSEVIKPGAEQEYARIEEDAAHACVAQHCANPYMAIETVSDPKEVWVISAYESAQQAQASRESADSDLAMRKQPLLAAPAQDAVASWVPALSGRPAWTMPGGRFLIITHTRGQPGAIGTVYAAEDGYLYEIRSAASLDEAKARQARGDPNARIFELRPNWGFPAKEWVAANPALWSAGATAR